MAQSLTCAEQRARFSANPYQIVDRSNNEELAGYLSHHGQFLLPMVELIEQNRLAVDELIELTGRAAIEGVLRLSAQRIAGPKHPGRQSDGEIGWHGSQRGVVSLRQTADHQAASAASPARRAGGSRDSRLPGDA